MSFGVFPNSPPEKKMATSISRVHDYSIVEYDLTTGDFTVKFGQKEGTVLCNFKSASLPDSQNECVTKTETTFSFYTPNNVVFSSGHRIMFKSIV